MLRQHYNKDQEAQNFERSGTRVKNIPTGQIFLEYMLVIGAVVLVMMAMNKMIKRGTQGMVKVVADQVGLQVNADQQFDDGYLKSSYVTTRVTTSKIKEEFAGQTTYTYGDVTVIHSNALINMGFTEEN